MRAPRVARRRSTIKGSLNHRRAEILAAVAAALVIAAASAAAIAHPGSQPSSQAAPPAAASVHGGATSAAPAVAAGAAATARAATATASPTPGTRPAAPPAVATATGCASVPGGPPTGTIAANFATALAFTPDGRLFFAERGGTIRVVLAGVPTTFATVPTVTGEAGGGYSERGLLGLAISPAYVTDHFVYAYYSATDRVHQLVARWTDCGGTGGGMTTLITLPSGADCCHKGGRIAFGPDGKLYVTLGEEHDASAAQDTGDLRGKVLRYNADGTVPADDPFGAGNPVWAYGLRNPFGIAFSPSGQLVVTSNGPSGDAGSPSTGYDLAISISRGMGYQWPLCYGFSHPIAPATSCNGEPGPDWSSEADVSGADTVVPTGAAFIDTAGPPALAGHLVFCTDARGMRVVHGGSPHATVTAGPPACKLDVKQSPDHAVYYSDEGHVYRLA